MKTIATKLFLLLALTAFTSACRAQLLNTNRPMKNNPVTITLAPSDGIFCETNWVNGTNNSGSTRIISLSNLVSVLESLPGWYVISNGVNYGNAFSSPHTGSTGEQFGNGASAVGNGSSAFGVAASSGGGFANAFGNGSSASGVYSTAIGRLTTATDSYAIAMGDHANAGYQSLAVGRQSSATPGFGDAFGAYATATDTNALAIGEHASATARNSTAIGNNASASVTNQIVLGGQAEGFGPYPNVVIPGTLQTSANNKLSLMSSNVSTGTYLWTNLLAGDCAVFIYGGTVSGIGVNGTQIGNAAAPYQIPLQPGEWIGITNSVAPTLAFKPF